MSLFWTIGNVVCIARYMKSFDLIHRYDEEHGIRDAFKIELEKVSIEIEISSNGLQYWHLFFIQKFGHLGLQFAKGGQISIDCFPTGIFS